MRERCAKKVVLKYRTQGFYTQVKNGSSFGSFKFCVTLKECSVLTGITHGPSWDTYTTSLLTTFVSQKGVLG